MLILVILMICFVFIPLMALCANFAIAFLQREQIQNVVDAACLLSAKGMSRVIINDENFGFVSLSSYTASGTNTVSADGEPVPVSSINSIIGTLRRNAIVAKELDNSDLNELVHADYQCLGIPFAT